MYRMTHTPVIVVVITTCRYYAVFAVILSSDEMKFQQWHRKIQENLYLFQLYLHTKWQSKFNSPKNELILFSQMLKKKKLHCIFIMPILGNEVIWGCFRSMFSIFLMGRYVKQY